MFQPMAVLGLWVPILLGIAFSLASWAMSKMEDALPYWAPRAAFIAAAICFLIAIIFGIWAATRSAPDTAPAKITFEASPMTNRIGDITNNQGIITQGQEGNNTIIQGEPRRRLGEAEKAQMLQRLSKDRRITITVVLNDSDAADLANEIYNFLSSEGFNVDRPEHAMMWGPNGTPRGVNINTQGGHPIAAR